MDTKYIINLIMFILFYILYFSTFSNYINEIVGGKNIAAGIAFIIAGVWGFCINRIMLKIAFFEKNPRIINCILIILGVILFIYAMVV